jgi:hypothetical protein
LDAAVAADPVERNEAKYSSQQANTNTAQRLRAAADRDARARDESSQ